VNKLREHPEYERVLNEVLLGQYQVELFAQVSLKSTDKTHAQALYIQAVLNEKIKNSS